MTKNAAKIGLGVCDVTFDGVDLGHTQGGVELNYAPTIHETKSDEYGETPLAMTLIGEMVTVKVPMLEWVLANLKVAMPGTTLAGTTTQQLQGGSTAGKSLDAEAGVLVLTPKKSPETPITLHRAVVNSEVTIGFVNDSDRIVEATFVALIDEAKTDGNRLFSIGQAPA